MNQDNREVYISMRDRFGFRSRLAKAAEECSELAAAINKLLAWELANRDAVSNESFSPLRQRVIDELGDTYTTLEGLADALQITDEELFEREIKNIAKMKKILDGSASAFNN